MKILHKLTNYDLINSSSLTEAFNKSSISKEEVNITQLGILAIKSEIVKLRIEFSQSNKSLFKICIYFPVKKYSLEFINDESESNVEFIYEMIDENEYFNLVLYDKEGLVISSGTYVFNNEKIVSYPLTDKDISEIMVDSDIRFNGNCIEFVTVEQNDLGEVHDVIHIWQNLGQNIVSNTNKEKNHVSSMELENMCSGIWMIIATDSFNKMISQYVVQV